MKYIEAVTETNREGQPCFSLAEPIPSTARRVELDAPNKRYVVYEDGDELPPGPA